MTHVDKVRYMWVVGNGSHQVDSPCDFILSVPFDILTIQMIPRATICQGPTYNDEAFSHRINVVDGVVTDIKLHTPCMRVDMVTLREVKGTLVSLLTILITLTFLYDVFSS